MALLILLHLMSRTGDKYQHGTTLPLAVLNFNPQWRSDWQQSQVACSKGSCVPRWGQQCWVHRSLDPAAKWMLTGIQDLGAQPSCWSWPAAPHPGCAPGDPPFQLCTNTKHSGSPLSLASFHGLQFHPLRPHPLTREPAEWSWISIHCSSVLAEREQQSDVLSSESVLLCWRMCDSPVPTRAASLPQHCTSPPASPIPISPLRKHYFPIVLPAFTVFAITSSGTEKIWWRSCFYIRNKNVFFSTFPTQVYICLPHWTGAQLRSHKPVCKVTSKWGLLEIVTPHFNILILGHR